MTGWWLLAVAWCRTQSRLSALVRDHARQRVAVKRDRLRTLADLAAARAVITGQHAEAARMSHELVRVQTELEACRVSLGRMSNRKHQQEAAQQ